MLKQILGIGAVCMVGGLTVLPVVAGEFEDRGDRIEHHLDARGDRINEHLDRRAERAAANGHPLRAAHLDERGDRINDRLDRRGQAIDARFDRRHQHS